MGFDVLRFNDIHLQEFICAICNDVVEDPLMTDCEHVFCSTCIRPWLHRQSTCPVDRKFVTVSTLKPLSRSLQNIWNGLQITCDNADLGCKEVVKLSCLTEHRASCEHNPNSKITCQFGCGLLIYKATQKEHNCVRDLRNVVDSVTIKAKNCEQALMEQRRISSSNQEEMQGLRQRVVKLEQELLRQRQMKLERPPIADFLVPPPPKIPATGTSTQSRQLQERAQAVQVAVSGRVIPQTPPTTSFTCEICNAQFTSKRSVSAHKRCHALRSNNDFLQAVKTNSTYNSLHQMLYEKSQQ